MLLVRTKSAAWFLMSCGMGGLGCPAERKSCCVVILRSVLGLLLEAAAFTYTGPVAEGFCILRGPPAMDGSGAASKSVVDSYLLCTDGTGLPRSSTEGASAAPLSAWMWSMLIDFPFHANLFGSSAAPYAALLLL